VCVGDNGGKDKLIEWGLAKHRTTDQDLPHPLKASKQASKQSKADIGCLNHTHTHTHTQQTHYYYCPTD